MLTNSSGGPVPGPKVQAVERALGIAGAAEHVVVDVEALGQVRLDCERGKSHLVRKAIAQSGADRNRAETLSSVLDCCSADPAIYTWCIPRDQQELEADIEEAIEAFFTPRDRRTCPRGLGGGYFW